MLKHIRVALKAARAVAEPLGFTCSCDEKSRGGHYKVVIWTAEGQALTQVIISSSPRTGCEEQENYARQQTRRAIAAALEARRSAPAQSARSLAARAPVAERKR